LEFSEVFREERYYCNHLFRLLCHEKETGGPRSGLGAVLSELGFSDNVTSADVNAAQIYTEVAVFRDIFVAEKDKDHFADDLFQLFLPMICSQHNWNVKEPIPPSAVRQKVGSVHPRKYAEELRKIHASESDVRLYNEFSALFNAKPDFLIIFRDKMFWVEAKFWASFSSSQIRRTRNIADLCRSALFEEYFRMREPIIVLLGLKKKHSKTRLTEGARFLSWEQCQKISEDLLPGGSANFTARSISRMMDFNRSHLPGA